MVQYGYMVNELQNSPQSGNKIHIDTFLKDKDILYKYITGKIFIVNKKGERLEKYQSIKRISHFKKWKSTGQTEKMSEWHKKWQSDIVKETGAASEVSFPKMENSYHDREADIYFKDRKNGFQLIEIQNSGISKSEVEERKEDYGLHNKEISWLVNCNRCELKIKKDKTCVITFKDLWLYENFKCYDYIFGNIDNKDLGNIVFKFNPNGVKSKTININKWIKRDTFINHIKDNNTELEYVSYKPVMIVHEKGAGNGKTYQSLQDLFEFSDFDKYDTFIVVTKVKSARDVLLHELKDQKKQGKLNDFDISDYNEVNNNGRYIIKFKNRDKVEKRIIMSTIDSLSYNIRKPDRNKRYREKFGENGGILKDIINGMDKLSENGGFTFAGEYIKLNSQTLMMIDEAQDLPPIYLNAFVEVIHKTNLNSYIIGNKLQSVYHLTNIITTLFDKNKKYSDLIDINLTFAPNICRRFHNIWHMKFVNHMVDFAKYELPKITGICPNNDGSCRHIHSDKKEDALEFFQIEKILPDEKDESKISKTVQSVIDIMENECISNCRLPNDFSIIVSIIKKNALLEPIQSELNNWWVKKLNDEGYKNRLKKERKEDYEVFKENQDYDKYFELHYSDNGLKPIQLQDSDYQIRCYSIHSSKGDGRPVVITLGITERSLLIHSVERNLKYDSLEHVCITRMKEKIYFGYVANNDNIHKKINTFCKKYNIDENVDDTIEPDILYSKNYKLEVSRICEGDSNEYQNIDEEIISKKSYASDIEKNKHKSMEDVDWGDHCIRNAVCIIHEWFWVYNKNIGTEKNKKEQITTILRKIQIIPINPCGNSKYNKFLWDKQFRNLKNELEFIPIKNNYRSQKIHKFIKTTMKNIQNKLSKIRNDEKLDCVCVIESLILWHMIDIFLNKGYASFGYTKLHNIIEIYVKSCNSNKTHQNNCICDKFIDFEDCDQNKIVSHYDRIKKLEFLLETFETTYKEKYPNTTQFEWNIHQQVELEGNTNFNIYKKYDHFITTDKHIISLIIKPKITMDIDDIIFETVLDNYLILNSKPDKNVHKKINDKQFLSVLISLDLDEPIFIEWGDYIKNNILFKDAIKKSLLKHYKQNNHNIYNFYKFCKKEKEEIGSKLNSIKYTITELKHERYKNLPSYILEYFNNLKGRLKQQKNKKKWLNENVENEKKFIESLDEELTESINSYLGIEFENDIGDY